jgi:hypothetical protein
MQQQQQEWQVRSEQQQRHQVGRDRAMRQQAGCSSSSSGGDNCDQSTSCSRFSCHNVVLCHTRCCGMQWRQSHGVASYNSLRQRGFVSSKKNKNVIVTTLPWRRCGNHIPVCASPVLPQVTGGHTEGRVRFPKAHTYLEFGWVHTNGNIWAPILNLKVLPS